jgi:valyl-tRNA synthetase
MIDRVRHPVETVEKLNKAFAEFRFDGMADTIYHFVWDQFCDWYLELIKPAFVDGEKQEMDAESKLVAGWVLDQILVMLHPFMPFITEELWHSMGERKKANGDELLLIHADWPMPKAEVHTEAKAEIDRVIEVVSDFRACRTAAKIEPKVRVQVGVLEANNFDRKLLETYQSSISKMVNLTFGKLQIEYDEKSNSWPTSFEFTDQVEDFVGRADQDVTAVRLRSKSLELIGSAEVGFVDVEGERTRITKAIEAATKERDALAGRLSNAAFVEKAKPEAVEKARADHAEKAAEAERLTAALARLG